jgi:N-acetylmuramoyl-L-alanine amidase
MPSVHVVAQGETIVRIAHEHGFRAWEPIWEHADNAALRQLRGNPHILAPGDELVIPDKAPRDFGCATNRRHVFKLRKLTQLFQTQLVDELDRPYTGRRFELEVEGTKIEGETDADGRVLAEIPVDAKSGKLRAWLVDDAAPSEWQLQLGHLDPIDTVSGAQARLANLGYACPLDGKLGDETKAAIAAFQHEQGLGETGELDADTTKRLAARHDQELEAKS